MQINLPRQAIEAVKTYLLQSVRGDDIGEFVDQSVQRALFFWLAEDVRQRNACVSADDLDAAIDEAVKNARRQKDRTKTKRR